MDTIALHLNDNDSEDENCINIRHELINLRNSSKDVLETER